MIFRGASLQEVIVSIFSMKLTGIFPTAQGWSKKETKWKRILSKTNIKQGGQVSFTNKSHVR